MLDMPSHILPLALAEAPVTFEANRSTINLIFDGDVPFVGEWMDVLTERAKLATGAALVEWIGWRLERFDAGRDLLQMAEAMWAATIDFRYAREIEWAEPRHVPAPEFMAFATFSKARALLRSTRELRGKSMLCPYLALLVRHVLPKVHQAAFRKWLKFVLDERVGKLYCIDQDSADEDERLGRLIPRETFDPAVPFPLAHGADLTAAFLRRLDPASNRWLLMPDEMHKQGFKGQPYPD